METVQWVTGFKENKGQSDLELKEQGEWNEIRLARRRGHLAYRPVRSAIGNSWKIFKQGCSTVGVNI